MSSSEHPNKLEDLDGQCVKGEKNAKARWKKGRKPEPLRGIPWTPSLPRPGWARKVFG